VAPGDRGGQRVHRQIGRRTRPRLDPGDKVRLARIRPRPPHRYPAEPAHRHSEVENSRADADEQLAAGRVDDRQPAMRVGVHVNTARPDTEPPRLAVVQRRRGHSRPDTRQQVAL
jgi:hypothetical protein